MPSKITSFFKGFFSMSNSFPPWIPPPWKPRISAEYNGDFIALVIHSGFSVVRRNIGIDPPLLDKNVDDESLGKAVLEALSKSKRFSKEEADFLIENWKELHASWVKRLMEKYGYRTKTAIFRNMMRCDIYYQKDHTLISPSFHERGESWSGEFLTEKDDIKLPHDSSHAEIGAALRLAFSRCRGQGASVLFPSKKS